MTDLSALIARLEAAEAGSRKLDREIWFALEFNSHGEPSLAPKYSGSLDAALALAERVCGDREWMIVKSNEDGVTSYHALIGPDSAERAGEARSPALALCLAVLKAHAHVD